MSTSPPPGRRAERRAARPIRRDITIDEWPEAGLVIAGGPADPRASVKVDGGRVVEIDGRGERDFDSIDRFIAARAIDPAVAQEAMATDPLEMARRLFDPSVPAAEARRLFAGLTPARLVEVVWRLDVLEMMLALRKMRLRRAPANQAHVTNRRDHPALLAADAAEAGLRGFAEVETTVGVAPIAPLNALAVLVGSQVGRPGVLTQAAVEEAVNLRLAMKGLVSYAETLSVYGTADAFRDGDDTPWSKAFLASAYASRGIKARFTSGSGSEALMGHAGGCSMLYLEARCLLVVKGAGSQGVQNGAISCIALVEALPSGVRGVLAENLLAAALGLELASGNDALSSHSEMRRSAKLMLQLLPGTDFVTSGYSLMPRGDNLFGGGNFDAEDLDDWTMLQRDLEADGGITPVREEDVVAVRERAARAVQALYAELGLPPIDDEEVRAAAAAYDSGDLPPRSQAADLAAAERFLRSELTILDAIAALERRGFGDAARALLALTRQRAAGDYLQPAAILEPRGEDLAAVSAINDPNLYSGPGTGYRLEGRRRREVAAVPHAQDPRRIGRTAGSRPLFREGGPAASGVGPEVVVAVGPAYGLRIEETLAGLTHRDVIESILRGIRDEGVRARLVRVRGTADCARIGHEGARLSGSGIAIGIQSRGTAVLHRRDLAPLDNLELLSQSPNLTLESYRALGRNAARRATGRESEPIPVKIDNTARLRLIVHTTLLHRIEVEAVEAGAPLVELELLPAGRKPGGGGGAP
ncbi:MAG: propanediol dehydratase [Planctomycetes bacterium]|nr:propanediol dehydratase [Planctomycetota bacterium]